MTHTPQPSEDDYTPARRRRILEIARSSVDAAVHGHRLEPDLADDEDYLREPRGCFVTLRRRSSGELRGCIGTFDDAAPLVENLVTMAAAATGDPRFVTDPVRPVELDTLRIDVSILTPRQPIGNPLHMEPGVDGIHMVAERHGQHISGCFLPEVASDQGWDAATTLSMCCGHKLGIDPDAWRPPTDLKFYTFRAIIIAEP